MTEPIAHRGPKPGRSALSSAVALLAVTLLLAGCVGWGFATSSPAPYPAGCAGLGFSSRRCAAIVARARTKAGLEADAEVTVGLLAPSNEGPRSLGGGQIAQVVFGLADGSSVVQPVMCFGVPAGPDDAVCSEPRLAVSSGVSHDVPCTGEPPDGCPSQIVPDSAATAAARPLKLATLDVPVGALGRYEVKVGEASFPNGYVTTLDAKVVNDQPADFWITGGIELDLRPADATRPPFGDVYMRPPVGGVERATLWLVFTVTETSPGAVLHLADLVAE